MKWFGCHFWWCDVNVSSYKFTYHLCNSLEYVDSWIWTHATTLIAPSYCQDWDYGNALLLRSNVPSINRLQMFQNWPAKLIFVPQNKIMPLRFFFFFFNHWLTVKERIYFFFFMFYRCLNGHAPDYLLFVTIFSKSSWTSFSTSYTRLAQPNISSKSLWSAANKAFSLAVPSLMESNTHCHSLIQLASYV